MIICSRAPLKLGLAAGGSTDVSSYSDIYGKVVLNVTIAIYAYATIEPRDDGKFVFYSIDRKEKVKYETKERLDINGRLDLLKGVYNRIVRDFVKKPLSFELSTNVNAFPGSGLVHLP